MEKRVKLKDVAEAAGVSVSAVSMALRGHPRISAARSAEIRQIAARLGYIYNRNAANLRQGRNDIVAVCVNDLKNPVFMEFLTAIESEFRREGKLLLLCNAHEDLAVQTEFVRKMQEQGAAGLLLSPAVGTGLDDLRAYRRAGLPIVLFSRTIPGADTFDQVLNDDRQGVWDAVRELYRLGHRNIAWIGGGLETTTALNRLDGYRAATADLALPHGPLLEERTAETSLEAGQQAMNRILDRAPQVSAVICFGDLLAIGAVSSCRKRGLCAGRDISIVGHDDIEEAAYVDPPLTTVRVCKQDIGRRVARLLVARIAEPTAPVERQIVSPKLILRDTTGPALLAPAALP